ncbi:ribonuclease HII [Georgenia sp. AZ-5]|uniref:ribonuclease HII n=1 Tax=Georgenia sp. AZ-5 TaxID=3367526 RepID=UPI003754527E
MTQEATTRRASRRRSATGRRPAPARRPRPSRVLETRLAADLGAPALVAGMDEVGRGALAGPVTVGVAVVGPSTSRRMPKGLADSKLLTPRAREDLVPPVRAWCTGSAVGHASPEEIDELGIIAALRLAGRRALAALAADGLVPGVVILDGVHDWLSEPAQGQLFAPEPPEVLVPGTGAPPPPMPPVRTQVKADQSCAVVAAASVLAKVERDAIMVGLAAEQPAYGWAGNKGYSAPEHIEALREHGPCALHRRSWRLPGLDDGVEACLADAADLAGLGELGPDEDAELAGLGDDLEADLDVDEAEDPALDAGRPGGAQWFVEPTLAFADAAEDGPGEASADVLVRRA